MTTDQKVTGLNPVGVTEKQPLTDKNVGGFFFVHTNVHTMADITLLKNTRRINQSAWTFS